MQFLRSARTLLALGLTLTLMAATAVRVGADHTSGPGPHIELTSPKAGSSTSRTMLFTGTVTARAPEYVQDRVTLSAKDLSNGNHWNGSSWVAGSATFLATTKVISRDADGDPTKLAFSGSVPATGHRMWMTVRVASEFNNFGNAALQLTNVGSGTGASGGSTPAPAPTPTTSPAPTPGPVSSGSTAHNVVLTSPTANTPTGSPIIFSGTAAASEFEFVAKDLTTKQYWNGSAWVNSYATFPSAGTSLAPAGADGSTRYRFTATVPATSHRMWVTVKSRSVSPVKLENLSFQMNNTAAGSGSTTTPTTGTPSGPTAPAMNAGDVTYSSPSTTFNGGQLVVSGRAAGTTASSAAPARVQVVIRDLKTRRYWNGSSWQLAFAGTDASLSSAGTTAAGVGVVNFTATVANAPANPYYITTRSISSTSRYGAFVARQTSTSGSTPSQPAPTPTPTTPPTTAPAPTPPTSGGGTTVEETDDSTAVRDNEKPAVVITKPSSVIHDGGNLLIAGTASDPGGIKRVEITVRELFDRKYWNGSSFETAFAINSVPVTNPGGTTTEWSVSVPTPAAPLYIAVRAIDEGNTYGDFVSVQTDLTGAAPVNGPTTPRPPSSTQPEINVPAGGSADKSRPALCAGPVRMGVAVDLYSHNPASANYEAGYDQTVDTEFCHVSSENSLKRSYLQTDDGRTNLQVADSFYATSERHGSTSRGHSLVWNYRDPGYIGRLSAADIRADMNDFIELAMTRYPGVDHWDVVNEPLDWGGRTFWTGVYDRLEPNGYPTVNLNTAETEAPNFVKEAFQIADRVRRENNLQTELWLNEANVLDPDSPKYGFKADVLYEMVKWMVENNIPIDGVGFQAHLKTPGLSPDTVWGSKYEVPVLDRQTAPVICENLRRYKRLGLKVAITEADIVIPLRATPQQLQDQIDGYKLMYQVAAEVGVADLTIWGLDDGRSFYEKLLDGNYVVPGYGQATLFDAQLQKKAVYNALKSFIDQYAAGNRPANVC